MVRLSKIIEELEIIAPSSLKCAWDNVGLLVGDENQKVNRVFLCLDITGENVKAARNTSCRHVYANRACGVRSIDVKN